LVLQLNLRMRAFFEVSVIMIVIKAAKAAASSKQHQQPAARSPPPPSPTPHLHAIRSRCPKELPQLPADLQHFARVQRIAQLKI
jgi:hypothetical protein